MAEKIGGAATFLGLVDLASAAVGGVVLGSSDEFFAGADNLVKPEAAVFDPDAYTDDGKLMDGWESRRRRTPGHDWAILKLGVPGRIRAVDIDTAHFLGNHAPFASLDATRAPSDATIEHLRDVADWVRIVPETTMRRGSPNFCATTSHAPFTHVRLNIYPDGGVARLRCYGEPEVSVRSEELVDLASVLNGGRTLASSDAFFSPMEQLIHPGRSSFMGGGWETRRSRPPGSDWILVRLGSPGELERIEVDTDHFKGNFPDRLAVDGIWWPHGTPTGLRDSPDWTEIVPSTAMAAHTTRAWDVRGAWTHLRVRIVPDGGIARLRAFGRAVDSGAEDPGLMRLASLSSDDLADAFRRCCGASRWVDAMVQAWPLGSRAELFGTAESAWWHLDEADWQEAFTHHPRIGASVDELRKKFGATADWSAGEQEAVGDAGAEVLEALAEGNRRYDARYGYLFIVCATGLTASEMLARLNERIDNPPANELRIAAGEQAKITRLRLGKLLEDA